MKEYKMRRGEHLDDRMPDLKASVEEYFGPVAGTEELEGHDVFVVEEPDNPVFKRIRAGAGRYSSKKDTIIVDFEERPAAEVLAEDHADAAEEAIDLKNDFLLEATGRDAKSRRESMKRAVEDDAEVPDEV